MHLFLMGGVLLFVQIDPVAKGVKIFVVKFLPNKRYIHEMR